LTNYTETARLQTLRGLGILDTPAEVGFDELVQAAACLCGAPLSAVSLVDADRQWFKAKVGLEADEAPRDVSFCTHAMHGGDVYVVPDAAQDALFAKNPLVVGDPRIRFYAGAPIRAPNGAPLGTLCVIDTVARPEGLNVDQRAVLRVLANQVESQIRLRNTFHAREEQLVGALDSAAVGWWDWEVATNRVTGNEEMAFAFGLSPDTAATGAPIEAFFANVHPTDRPMLQDAIDDAIASGAPFREEYRLLRPDGSERWVSARGRYLQQTGRFPGVILDITESKNADARLRDSDIGRELAMQAANLGRFDHHPYRGARYYDDRALEMMGLTAEEVSDLNHVLHKVVHAEDRHRMAAALAAAVDSGRAGPFKETFRIIHAQTGELRWIAVSGRSQFVDGICTRFMGVFEDVTEAKLAEEHRRLLTNELNHRVKNTLAVVVTLVDQSLRGSTDLAAARADVAGRIQALSRAHDILTADNWSDAAISDIGAQVARSLSLPADRLEMSGPPIRLGPRPALQLSLALHELSTNALKYGALSNEDGRVSLMWAIDGSALRVTWAERGGPTVIPPSRRGFGSVLMEKATGAAFGGQAVIDYRPVGVLWTLAAPLAGLAESGRGEQPAPPQATG
jgi:PAS domain S-box-containing protein